MKKKITKHFDRIIMGAIIGGAIGSVIGSKLRKNSQSENSEELPLPFEKNEERPKKKGLLRKLLGL